MLQNYNITVQIESHFLDKKDQTLTDGRLIQWNLKSKYISENLDPVSSIKISTSASKHSTILKHYECNALKAV